MRPVKNEQRDEGSANFPAGDCFFVELDTDPGPIGKSDIAILWSQAGLRSDEPLEVIDILLEGEELDG